jgi:hypothetical protein
MTVMIIFVDSEDEWKEPAVCLGPYPDRDEAEEALRQYIYTIEPDWLEVFTWYIIPVLSWDQLKRAADEMSDPESEVWWPKGWQGPLDIDGKQYLNTPLNRVEWE